MAAIEDPLVARVQELSSRLDELDPVARETAEALVAAVVEMYGEGLERIVGELAAAGAAGEAIRDRLAADGVVASLLLIHDLYPVPLEERVLQGLERVRPYMESHGGNVELLGVTDGIARLRLEGSCSSCQASSVTLELAVRKALMETAPDLVGMEVEESTSVGMPLPMAGTPSWFDLDGAVAELPLEALTAIDVAGMSLVVANVEGTLLAYRNSCADCSGRLDAGELSEGVLTCPSCGRSYFLPRAGRSLDDERLQLGPVPLLRENGSVRVALTA
jgi:Fe-S cluster biogenesis protein NfuA/nitrite reductase/ring-hydroxylating ferredoxin subunit